MNSPGKISEKQSGTDIKQRCFFGRPLRSQGTCLKIQFTDVWESNRTCGDYDDFMTGELAHDWTMKSRNEEDLKIITMRLSSVDRGGEHSIS